MGKWLALAAGVLLAAGGALFWWMNRTVTPDALESDWVGTVATIAGDGRALARDGDTFHAGFAEPFGVAVSPSGAIFVTDAGNAHRIRRIDPDGRVSTIAGGARGFVDGIGTAARFSTPSGIAIDGSGTLYVADTGNNAIRRITADGQVSTFAGDGVAGDRDGPARDARFNGPIGVAVAADGRVIVADSYNDRIRAIDAHGQVQTLAGGSQPGLVDGAALDARFHTPSGVAVDRTGNVLVADTGNNVVRVIDRNGAVTTAAWSSVAGVLRPTGIAATPDDRVVVTDDRGRILTATAAGSVHTVAGSTPGFKEGRGTEVRFRNPTGIAAPAPGRLIVADAGNAIVRLVGAPSRLELRLPPSPLVDPRFDAEPFRLMPLLWPVPPFEGPHEIAGTIGEARGAEGSERFHAGVDVRIDEGTLVYAIRDGIVSSPVSSGSFGTLNEWLRIGPLTYIHIRVAREGRSTLFGDDRFVPAYDNGKLSEVRVKRGATFAAGDVIATVNPFNHVHLNIGPPGEEINPLEFPLVQYEDTIAPTIAPNGIRLYDPSWQPLTMRAKGRTLVAGPVQIVVDAWDQSNGNRPERRLGLYELGYQVLTRDGQPAPGFETVRHTLRFDRLPQGADSPSLIYAPGSGIPFYGRRRTRFLYIVTNMLQDGVATASSWDTSALPPGDYIVRVWAADIRGNVAMANRDLPVTIAAGPG